MCEAGVNTAATMNVRTSDFYELTSKVNRHLSVSVDIIASCDEAVWSKGSKPYFKGKRALCNTGMDGTAQGCIATLVVLLNVS